MPIDFGGCICTTICADPYVELLKHLGWDDLGPPIVPEPFGMTVRLAEPVRQRLHSDIIELENPFCFDWRLEAKDWKPWRTSRGNEVLVPGSFNPVADERGYLHVRDWQGKLAGVRAPARWRSTAPAPPA